MYGMCGFLYCILLCNDVTLHYDVENFARCIFAVLLIPRL